MPSNSLLPSLLILLCLSPCNTPFAAGSKVPHLGIARCSTGSTWRDYRLSDEITDAPRDWQRHLTLTVFCVGEYSESLLHGRHPCPYTWKGDVTRGHRPERLLPISESYVVGWWAASSFGDEVLSAGPLMLVMFIHPYLDDRPLPGACATGVDPCQFAARRGERVVWTSDLWISLK